MNKKIAVLTAVFMLFAFAACSTENDPQIDNTEILLTIDGETVITGEFFNSYLAEQRFIEEYYESEKISASELFKKLAQYKAVEYIAKKYNIEVNQAQIEAEYDEYLENAQSDNELRRYLRSMKNSMKMTDEEFRIYRVQDSMMVEYADKLVSEIAAEYSSVTDAEMLSELVHNNMLALLDGREIAISYPGLENWNIDFGYIVSTGN